MSRPKGRKNNPKLHLTSEVVDSTNGKPTRAEIHQALKLRVALYTKDGMLPEKISALLGIPIDELRILYAHELEHGREIVRGEELVMLYRASVGQGKVSASKLILATPGAEMSPATPEADAAKSKHDNVVKMALRMMNGGKK